MKKWNFLKMVGFTTAVVLILFGGVDNLWRTVRFALEKWLKS